MNENCVQVTQLHSHNYNSTFIGSIFFSFFLNSLIFFSLHYLQYILHCVFHNYSIIYIEISERLTGIKSYELKVTLEIPYIVDADLSFLSTIKKKTGLNSDTMDPPKYDQKSCLDKLYILFFFKKKIKIKLTLFLIFFSPSIYSRYFCFAIVL